MKVLNVVALLLSESITAQSVSPTTQFNYKNTLDQSVLAQQEACRTNDYGNTSIQSGQLQPSCFKGFSLRNDFSMNTSPPYSNNIDQITSNDCGSSLSNPGDVVGIWCSSDFSGRRSCAVKGLQQGETLRKKLDVQCISLIGCEEYSFNANQWVFNACPNLQCAAYTYRSGPENQERYNGKLVFRQSGCLQVGNKDTNRNNCDQLISPSTATSPGYSLPGHYRSIVPFQCIHDECSASNGQYIQKGNTDSGPTNHLSVNRALIEPFWQPGINTYRSSNSASQGRCGTCQPYEVSTQEQDILTYGWNQYDSNTGQLRPGASTKVVGRGSLGCRRCPDYEKRDFNGQCRRLSCPPNQILVKDGANQGECVSCQPGQTPDALGTSCGGCQPGQSLQTRTNQFGQQEQYCGCNSRSVTSNFGSTCQQCADYQCANQQLNRCVQPYCQSNQIIRPDCQCENCPPGSTPDSTYRSCTNSVPTCADWTRLQPGGNCGSDPCAPGSKIIQNGQGQGTCVPCLGGQTSSYPYRYCSSPQLTCGANQQLDSTRTRCVEIPCPPYTRRQQDGSTCLPDRCTPAERNIEYENFQFGTTQRQGSCVRCPQGQISSQPDPLNYNARTRCIAPTCASNEITTQTGGCQACTGCSSPDFSKRACVEIQCYGREILRRTGQVSSCQCEQCPGKQVPNAGRTSCVACPVSSYINAYGECNRCPNYPRETQSADGFSCESKRCGARQFLNPSGECQNCPAYQISDGTQCYEPQCGDRQIISTDGQLENCPAYTRMVVDADGRRCRKCGEDTCTSRDFLTTEGYCYPCDNYTVPDATKRECIQPTCPASSIVTVSGGCQPCDRGTNPDQYQRQCVQLQCNARQRIVQQGSVAECVDCESGTRAQENQTVCGPDTCDPVNKREFTRDDGLCIPCPAYQILNDQKTGCVDPQCGENQIVTEQGKCEQCPEYQRRVDYGDSFGFGSQRYQCQECYCYQGNQFCQKNGLCETCPPFTVPSTNGRECVRPECPENAQVVQEDGQCGSCDDYHYYDSDQEKCLPRNCDERSFVTRNGQCSECPTYYFVTADKRDCEFCNCGPREICQENGKCQACPDFEIIATSGDKAGQCIRAQCENGVLQTDGSCVLCQACESLNEDKTQCVKPTCGPREILDYNGKCDECPKFTGPSGDECGGYCTSCQASGRDFIREQDGKCENCPDYNRISADRRQCSAVQCKANEILSIDGFCSACPDFTIPDSENKQCKTVQCLDGEILKPDGTCEKCEKFFRPDPMGRICIQSACTDAEYFDEKGNCQQCGPCSRSSLDNKRQKCFSDNCGASQILLSDGRCNNCPAYTKPTDTEDSQGKCGQICKAVECAQNEIVLEDGTCQACPSWTMPQQNARVCGPSICGARERLLISGRCEECGDYLRGAGTQQGGQFTECGSENCATNQILTVDGTCKYCNAYEKADAEGKKCLIPECGDRTQRLLPDATFEACPEYSRATANCRQCAPDPCNLRQKLLMNGMCEDCGDYQRSTPDGRDCRTPVCEKNQILLKDGTCQDCPPFQKRADGGRQCVEVTCSQTERLLPTGECESCEAYSRAINDGKACAPMLCTQRQKILVDGTCENCPQFTRSTSDRKGCQSQVCTARQILQVDGRCAECYPYTRADAEGKICVPHNCSDRHRLGPDGSCLECPAFERAQGTGLTCGSDQCNIRQRVLRDGTCKYCELFYAVSNNRRQCIRPVCKPMVEYISMEGICKECKFYETTAPSGTECMRDPTKKLPDPQIMAPTPISLQSTPPPVNAANNGYDVWTDEQFLSEDRATGFYLNQNTGNWGFILGSAIKITSTVAAIATSLLIALNAL